MVKRFLFLIFLFSLPTTFLFGQEEESSSKPISAIDVYGLVNVKKEEVLSWIQTKVGGNFDETVWANDKVTLLKTGLFLSIEMKEVVRSKYVRLTIMLEEKDFKRTVKSIVVKGLKVIPPAQVISTMKTQVGYNFNQKTLDSDILKLHGMDFSKDIKVNTTHHQDGFVIEIFMSEDIDWYDDFIVEMPTGTKSGIRKHMEEQILLSKDGGYLDETHIEMVKRRIREFFKTKGFFFVDIKTTVKLIDERKILIFTIDRGSKLKLGELNYIGNEKYTQKHLISKANIGLRPFWKYVKGNVFDEGKFEEDKSRLYQYYSMNGFLDVKIEISPFIYNASKDRLFVNFTFDEGPRYFVGDIKFVGNTIFEKEDLYAVLKSLPGSPYNSRVTYDDSKNIEGLYGEEGRLFTIVDPRISFDSERHIVNIIYFIRESNVTKVGKVFINGNDVTKETVFLKELTLFPGDVYDKYKFDQSKRNILRLPFVDTNPQELKMEMVPGEKGTGDLMINVKERQSGALTFNVTYSDISQFTGGVKVSESNFNWMGLFSGESLKGGGQSLSIEGQGGYKSQNYQVNFMNPMIFDIPINFGMSSYYTTLRLREFERSVLGGSVSLGTRVFGDLRANIGYRLENVKIDNLADNVAQIIQDEPKDYLISALKLSLTYDKRNNVVMPYDGYLVRASETLGEGILLGERTFTTSSFDFTKYFYVGDRLDELNQKKFPIYFVFHLEADASFEYDGDTVPLTERFLTGGNASIRGFKPMRLGPKDDDGRLYPGNFRAVGNFEFNFPLWDQIIYLAPFIDAGYAWAEFSDFDEKAIRVSTGLTFKIRIPALQNQPILLSFSYPLHEKNDEVERFAFSFVTNF